MDPALCGHDSTETGRDPQLSMHYTEDELRLLAEVLPGVSAQLRGSLANLYMAFSRIATPERRAEDAELDAQAALVQQSYYRLLRLSGNLTDATRLLQSNPLPLQNLDLCAVAKEVYRECLPLAELADRRLVFAAEDDPMITALHKESVQRILYHLLSNALKFSPAGSEITLRCRLSGNHALVTVRDNGPGIGAEKLEQLLETPLSALKAEPTPHGLGLGLPLAKAMAEGMGGRLLLESNPAGTLATLALPIRQTAAIVRDLPFQYTGGFSAPLTELSDALPVRAFLQNPAAQER